MKLNPFPFLLKYGPFILGVCISSVILVWGTVVLQSVFQPATNLATRSPLPQTLVQTQPPKLDPAPSLPQANLPLRPVVPPTGAGTVPPPTAPPTATPNPPARPRVELPQSRFGHLPYREHAAEDLVAVGSYGTGSDRRTEYLDREAAAAFAAMVTAAQAQDIALIPISGFRSVTDQTALFQRQVQRQGSEDAAARLSAPPGYSEHHSGYALDIGDGDRPQTDVTYTFGETAAYQWLQENAAEFGFELSFPPNNLQGVNFEPWHWRFVNSTRAAAIFAVAETLAAPP